ncbi:MAG: hypothetical protein HW420_900 [Candidatus Nitrosotenuis sp.]|nr:hypothetical protein [Candidatus Nitrosotenuis sp.]
MSYCIEYGDEAEVFFCKTERKPIDEYLIAMKECTELECYCKKHIPGS